MKRGRSASGKVLLGDVGPDLFLEVHPVAEERSSKKKECLYLGKVKLRLTKPIGENELTHFPIFLLLLQ